MRQITFATPASMPAGDPVELQCKLLFDDDIHCSSSSQDFQEHDLDKWANGYCGSLPSNGRDANT